MGQWKKHIKAVLVAEFEAREPARQLDALVCNAGALLHERKMTSEGVEMTSATHLIFGSYLLTELLLPALNRAKAPRVLLVSSGGMCVVTYQTRAALGAQRPSFPLFSFFSFSGFIYADAFGCAGL